MFYIGCHVSSAGGYTAAATHANALGGSTFALFTRNPRGGSVKPLDEADMAAFSAFCCAHEMGPMVAHAPYTLNPCGAKDNVRDFAFRAFSEDLARLEYVPGNYYNFHPGSHVGQGIPAGIELICGLLNRVLWPEMHTTVLLETMAGKGSEVGGRFEELRGIIDRAAHGDQIGVCLDACHVFDAGYDIVNDLDGVLAEFDRVIGLDRLKALHLNDSKNPCGAHKDRHEKIGQGYLGLETFRRILGHPALQGLPMILETPNELPGYAAEIALLRGN